MIRIVFLFLLGLGWSFSASAIDLEFKGLSIGSTAKPEQVVENLKVACEQIGKPCDDFWQKIHNDSAVKCGEGYQGKQICNGKTTIVGEIATANIVIGSDSRLERIRLIVSNYAYESILLELTKKYGKPSSVKRYNMQNGFGAVFTQVDSTWIRANGNFLLISKFAGNVDESVVHFGISTDRVTQSRKSGDL